MALTAKTGTSEVGHQARKRLAQLARSESFIPSEKARELATELERLSALNVEAIEAEDSMLAAELLLQLLAPAADRSYAAEGALDALPPCRAPCAGNREPTIRHHRLRPAREPRRVYGQPQVRASPQVGILVSARGLSADCYERFEMVSGHPSERRSR